ncbi:RNA-binding (RRM/RBD/RNP motifs) family protein [Raphanus sativus]|nr:RNA-binding (RRM/RBD/RNP motifs) family protein [Raphanus sativus]
MDDNNSVYVGGLPYDITEEALRRVFSPYGTVLDIKIVNDQSVRGKCYGFVTFSNRRSADDAIQDMDGKRIGGRAVRVNEVTTRFGGRLNPGALGRFQPQSPDGRSDFSCERDRYYRERDRSQGRRRDHYEHDMVVVDRNGYKERVFEGGEWRGDSGRGVNGTSGHQGRSQETKRDDSSMLDGGRGRDGKDHISNSSGDHSFQPREEIEAMIKTRDVLHDEVLVMEERLRAKEDSCTDLQKKCERLEDLLNDEKKLTSQRRKELAKLHKSFSRVRECTDNLKDCEQELQSLVNSVAREGGVAGADEGLENGYA